MVQSKSYPRMDTNSTNWKRKAMEFSLFWTKPGIEGSLSAGVICTKAEVPVRAQKVRTYPRRTRIARTGKGNQTWNRGEFIRRSILYAGGSPREGTMVQSKSYPRMDTNNTKWKRKAIEFSPFWTKPCPPAKGPTGRAVDGKLKQIETLKVRNGSRAPIPQSQI